MAYFELKPSKAASGAAKNPRLDYSRFGAAIPREIIEFGYIPDLGQMKPGDIVLVRPETPPAKPTQPIKHFKSILSGDASYYIQTAQKKIERSPNYLWVHAALYLGRDLVVEAVAPKVAVNTFSSHAAKRCVRIRRMPNISRAKAYDACIEAVRRIGDSYDTEAIKNLSIHFLTEKKIAPDLIKAAYICSELIQHAFLYGASAVIVNVGNIRTPTPADLSASPYLRDVPLQWRPI